MNVLQQFDTVSASEEGAWLHLTIPGSDEKAYLDEDQKKPLRIKLKGPDSDTWTAFQRKAMRAKQNDKSVEETTNEDAKLFSRMTVAWENIPDDSGKDLEFTTENAIKIYRKYKDIRIQALRFVMDQANFTKRQPDA